MNILHWQHIHNQPETFQETFTCGQKPATERSSYNFQTQSHT